MSWKLLKLDTKTSNWNFVFESKSITECKNILEKEDDIQNQIVLWGGETPDSQEKQYEILEQIIDVNQHLNAMLLTGAEIKPFDNSAESFSTESIYKDCGGRSSSCLCIMQFNKRLGTCWMLVEQFPGKNILIPCPELNPCGYVDRNTPTIPK